MLDVLSNAVSTLSAKENGESSELIESLGVGVMGNLGTLCHTLSQKRLNTSSLQVESVPKMQYNFEYSLKILLSF